MNLMRCPGPQRARRTAGRRRARPVGRTCADLAARAERPACFRSHRRRHRAPGAGARTPDADHHPQGRQGGHHPAGAADCPGDRLAIGERTGGPVFLAADGRRLDRHGAGRTVRKIAPPRRNRQSRHAPYAQACVHHGRAGRWGPATRRAGSRLSCRSADHDAVRAGPRQPGPAFHLHRRRLCSGRRPVVTYALGELRPAVTSRRAGLPFRWAITYGDPGTYTSRRSDRPEAVQS